MTAYLGFFFVLTPLPPACLVFLRAPAEWLAEASAPPMPLSACAMMDSSLSRVPVATAHQTAQCPQREKERRGAGANEYPRGCTP